MYRELMERRKKQSAAEAQATLDFIEKGTAFQKCPGCKNIVERTRGCPHMSCSCGTQFCYSILPHLHLSSSPLPLSK